jgi:hypothetical protein
MARTSVWGVEKWRVRHYPTSEAIETCPGREDQQILASNVATKPQILESEEKKSVRA